MRHGRAVIGTLIAAVCVFLALVLATDTALADPADSAPTQFGGATGDATATDTQLPGDTADSAPLPAYTAEGKGHSPFDDCRHRRPSRASLAAPAVPQPDPDEPGGTRAEFGDAAGARVPGLDDPRAALPGSGDRLSLLQVFRC
ncbi:hypothetical protein [Streptomyces sp. NPDC002851]